MDYLTFDLLAVALPAALLLRGGQGRRALLGPVALLTGVALTWTAPWDEYIVRTGVWSYAPEAVRAQIGAVPAEEYLFVVLEVVLVSAWALRCGALSVRGFDVEAGARHRGALGWAAVALTGVALVLVGGHLRYLGLLLVWAAPPLALQHAVGGDALHARRSARLTAALPVAAWLAVADRLALAAGTWTIAPSSSTGLALLGLPVEEGLFFGLTALLVVDGLVLAVDPDVRARALGLVRRRRVLAA